MKAYDIIIIGAGPGGIFAAYELMKQKPDLKVAVFEAGHMLNKRKCPIDGVKIKSCIHCKSCSIMSGFGGAGAFSDGKYNITNDFGGTLYEYIGRKEALELMLKKNHDYDEAWRSMRVSSYTDFILTKIQRVKEIEDIAGATLVSEGIDANYMDMINYSVFGLIKLEFGE